MPRVIIRTRTTAHDAAEAYARISDFARYPQLTEAVKDVVLHPAEADGSIVSEWTVHFRKGLLRWTERDLLDPVARTITFTQVKGDFVEFSGVWLVEPSEQGTEVIFDATFDLGIPTLADILDPIAEATLRSNILIILRGLLGEVTELGEQTELAVAGERQHG
jgi:ribosome-associated toxin RatA of RatAB toxin-antitoxin module